jgi:acetyltransferase-like isoleucine patch superfamily enzyme
MLDQTSLLRKVFRHPTRIVPVLLALGRGWWCKLWFPLTGRRFTAGRNFRVEGRLVVQGPGRVIFGDNVIIGMTVTPWTHHPDAVITVGNGTFLNGARFGCAERITIGARCIIGESRFMDTNFHSVEINRHDPAAPVTVAPITIGDNVWVAASCGLLPGTQVGTNSVVGFGSVCNGSYPAEALIAGNPARVLRSLVPPLDRPPV